ncbi:Non-receptor tyrosine-protein kinase TNK1 [Manis javanica]|nr:Non-receptor tyrosine-protein kinase TNK1 [Manis javanica]
MDQRSKKQSFGNPPQGLLLQKSLTIRVVFESIWLQAWAVSTRDTDLNVPVKKHKFSSVFIDSAYNFGSLSGNELKEAVCQQPFTEPKSLGRKLEFGDEGAVLPPTSAPSSSFHSPSSRDPLWQMLEWGTAVMSLQLTGKTVTYFQRTLDSDNWKENETSLQPQSSTKGSEGWDF